MDGGGGERPGVLCLLVAHDGERWLPVVLAGLADQQVAPDTVVAVDTGSSDGTPALLAEAFGPGAVRRLPAGTSYAAAVREGLDQTPDCPWVWLLHDDSTPDPGALAALLEAAAADPEAAILGPKLREWPSLRRLLEVGVTVTGTGRRETGLEPGEYDQGQHDEVRPVLAVNTAGMLLRRSVLEELGGFDEHLPLFGADVDLGWRAARAGHRVVVAPQAVVFHAEAASRGLRGSDLTGGRPDRARRAGSLHTVLANTTGVLLPLQVLRLLVGGLLRSLVHLLARSPRRAGAELGALGDVYLHPSRLRAARRSRAGLGPNDRRVRRLLAPWWLPYRHALDVVGGLVAAVGHEAADRYDRSERRRPARLLADPVTWVLVVAVLALLWAARDAWPGSNLSAAGLSPVPAGATDWWRLLLDVRHPLGQGSDAPAPAYLLPLALLATLLGGHPGAALGLVLLLAAPVAAWGAWRLVRTAAGLAGLAAPRTALAWGAVTYGLVPLTSGAWGQGRLGAVVGAAVLPWLAHAALGLVHPQRDRRWRSGWRSAVLLALMTAFAPVAWALGAALALLLSLVGVVHRSREPSRWLPPLVPVLATPVLLLPWTLAALGRPYLLLLEAGRLPGSLVDGAGAAVGRLGSHGAPVWAGLVVSALAVAALLVPRVRAAALSAWAVAAVAALLLAALAGRTLDLPSGSARAGVTVLVVVLAGCAVAAASLGLAALPRALVLLAVVVAAVAPVAGLVWSVTSAGDGLDGGRDAVVPTYMSQDAARAPERGVLLLRGTVDHGLDYEVVRNGGVTLGEDEILAATPPSAGLTSLVGALVSRPDADVVPRLAAYGVEYVLLPAPADGRVASDLDATEGLEPASAADPGTRAWHLTTAPSATDLDGRGSTGRTLLLLAQGILLLAALVLCGPARREEAA